MLNIDLVSDLHVDQWDPCLPNLYPCGKVSDFPLDWSKMNHSRILVVAGDTSDNLDITLQYLNEISRHYEKVLWVDGNHEHCHLYPDLYTEEQILEKLKVLGNEKLVYLPKQEYVEEGIVFIGGCGWWDYLQDTNLDKRDFNYFKRWRSNLGLSDGKKFIENLINEGTKQIERLKNTIQKYEKDTSINTIVLVTHTVPIESLATYKRTEYNSLYQNLTLQEGKLKYWLFGHTHQQIDKKMNINFIANPRGRPEDFNRKKYQVRKIQISKL